MSTTNNSTEHINIDMHRAKFGENAQLAVKLKLILLELQHYNPELSFVANVGSDTTISGVSVFLKHEPLGSIRIEVREHDNAFVYKIESENIVRKRGDKYVQRTKNLKSAMAIIKEAFKPMPVDAKAVAIIEECQNKIDSLRSTAEWQMDRLFDICTGELAEFLITVHNGNEPVSKLPEDLITAIGKDRDNWYEKANALRISRILGRQCVARQGIAARIERTGAITTVDLRTKTLQELANTYGLPINYQEKITMLKIVEYNQPIEHVGVKFEFSEIRNGVKQTVDLFFLVEGETFTDC